MKARFWQIVRFGLVGVANTAVYYLFYRLLLLGLPYLTAHLVAWSGSVAFSYLANCRFTYRVKPSWRGLLAFPLTTLVNVGFTTLGAVGLVEGLSADPRYATVVAGILAIPFTYALTTLIIMRSNDGSLDSPSGNART